MELFIYVEKVAEEEEDDILTSIFKCSFFNYKDCLNAADRRQFVEMIVEIGTGICAILKICPTGECQQSDGYISILVSPLCENVTMIPLNVNVSVLDADFNSVYIHADEKFTWVTRGRFIGVSEVMPSDMFFDEEGRSLIDHGCLTILVNVSIDLELLLVPLLRDTVSETHQNLQRKSGENWRISNTILRIGDEQVDVNRDALIRGSPAFENFFKEAVPVGSVYNTANRNPTDAALDVVICHMKQYEEID